MAIGAPGAVADARGRPLLDLRISVMDRCNFRCPYCMPRETYRRGLPLPARRRTPVASTKSSASRAPSPPTGRAQDAPDRRRAAAAHRIWPSWWRELSAHRRHRGSRADHQRRAARPARAELAAQGLVARDGEPRLARSGDVPPDERRTRRARPRAGRHRAPRARPGLAPSQDQCGRPARRQRRAGARPGRAFPRHGRRASASSSTWTSATATTGSPGSVVPSRAIRRCDRARWPLRALAPALRRRSRRALRASRTAQGEIGFISSVTPAVLRRLHARAPVLGRRASTPACSRRAGTDLRAALRAGASDEELRRHDPRACGARARTATANCASARRGRARRARSRCTTLADEAKMLSHVGADGAPAMVDVSAKSRPCARERQRDRCASRRRRSTRLHAAGFAPRRARSSTPRSSPARWRRSARTS